MVTGRTEAGTLSGGANGQNVQLSASHVMVQTPNLAAVGQGTQPCTAFRNPLWSKKEM